MKCRMKCAIKACRCLCATSNLGHTCLLNDRVRYGDLLHPCGHRFSCSNQIRGSPWPRPAVRSVRPCAIARPRGPGAPRGP